MDRNYQTFGVLKALKLNDYVASCRQQLHQGRIEDKKRAIMDRKQKQEDLKADIKKARQVAVERMLEAEKGEATAFTNMMGKLGYERQKTLDELYLERDLEEDIKIAEGKDNEEAQVLGDEKADGMWGGERPNTPSKTPSAGNTGV